MSEVGEGLIVYCAQCDYAATDEKAKVVYDIKKPDEDMGKWRRYIPRSYNYR